MKGTRNTGTGWIALGLIALAACGSEAPPGDDPPTNAGSSAASTGGGGDDMPIAGSAGMGGISGGGGDTPIAGGAGMDGTSGAGSGNDGDCQGYDDYLDDPQAFIDEVAARMGLENWKAGTCVTGASNFETDGTNSGTSCWMFNRRPCTAPPCQQALYDELLACARGEMPETCTNCESDAVLAARVNRTCRSGVRLFVEWCNENNGSSFTCPDDACN